MRLLDLYRYMHSRIHSTSRPLKLIYHVAERETLLAWVCSFLFTDTFTMLLCTTSKYCTRLSLASISHHCGKCIWFLAESQTRRLISFSYLSAHNEGGVGRQVAQHKDLKRRGTASLALTNLHKNLSVKMTCWGVWCWDVWTEPNQQFPHSRSLC